MLIDFRGLSSEPVAWNLLLDLRSGERGEQLDVLIPPGPGPAMVANHGHDLWTVAIKGTPARALILTQVLQGRVTKNL